METLNGVMGALMAKHGITTFDGILDGNEGLWKIRGLKYCDFELMVAGLGDKWYFLENSYKPWPSCRRTHHPITLFLQTIENNGIRPEQIERVLIQAHPSGAGKRFQNKNPIGMISCEFNQPHSLAMIALGIERGPGWYTPEIMTDPRVASFRQKVDVETKQVPAEAKEWPRQEQVTRLPTSLYVTARGRPFEAHGDYAKGDPWTPETYFTDEDLKAKFTDMAKSAKVASKRWREKLETIIETVFRLHEVDDLGCLTTLLAK